VGAAAQLGPQRDWSAAAGLVDRRRVNRPQRR